MIKKIIACLTICFIITGIISPVFSDASALPQPNWSDPGISEIINISDLTGWMLNGGTYDVSTYTDAESFMNDYFAARTKTRLEGSDYVIKSSFGLEQQYYEIGDSAYAHPLDINRVIASSYRDHSGYGRRLSNEVNDSLLSTGSLYSTKIPLLNDVEFANFVGYNHDALRLYSEFFTTEPDPNAPTPDPAYNSYIDAFNGSGFFWSDFSSPLSGYRGNASFSGNIKDYSYIIRTPFGNDTIGSTSSGLVFPTNIIDLNITYNGTNYTGTISNVNNISNFIYAGGFYWNAVSFTGTNGYDNMINNSNNVSNYSYSYTGTLANVLTYFSNRIKNVNIYVDGVAWALVNAPTPTPTITPEFPDAVGGEDLESTTWPISRPRAPYYTNVPGVLQAIEDAIVDDGKLDIDDLKPYLTDENGDPVPDPIFDPEPVPIPVPDPVNPDVVPGLPILPAIPPEMPGFNGVSVLAEIINFTNQSLPTSLIVTFWGIVFGIVILGLIKILHK